MFYAAGIDRSQSIVFVDPERACGRGDVNAKDRPCSRYCTFFRSRVTPEQPLCQLHLV